jgi:predicted nucleic acid-binding protein
MSDSGKTIIISDTSCLIGLSNIGEMDILRQLFSTITITPEIAGEYGDVLPDWVIIKSVNKRENINEINKVLHLGEASAIALAMETENTLLILDDKKARKYAKSKGLYITGTQGVLSLAEEHGIITSAQAYLERLRNIGFRV